MHWRLFADNFITSFSFSYFMERGKHVLSLANRIAKQLKPFSKRIQIVGSIRRHEENPKDVDIVLIPKNKEKLKEFLMKKGRFIQGGEHESTCRIEGVKVELYYAESEDWGAMLLAFSGKKGSNIGLRVIARTKGFKLTQHGLFRKGKRIAGKTEKEIYSVLGRSYKNPEDR